MPEGPIDDLILQKLRVLITTATEPARLADAITAEGFGLQPATVLDLANLLSVKARAFLLPLVR